MQKNPLIKQKLLEIWKVIRYWLICKIQLLSQLPAMNTWNLKLKRKNLFTITLPLPQKKYLSINIKKQVQCGLYPQNYSSLFKEIKNDLNKWSNILFPRIEEPNTFKVLILPNLISRCKADETLPSSLVRFWARSRHPSGWGPCSLARHLLSWSVIVLRLWPSHGRVRRSNSVWREMT